MSAGHHFARWYIALLIAAITACGGGGGGGSSSPPPPAVAASKIFVGDSGHAAIGSAGNSTPSPGSQIVDRVITGSNTMLSSSLTDFALDAAHDRLYVSDLRSILVFDNISTANGNVAPSRVLSSFGPLGGFVGIYLDTVNDRLYAGVNLGFQTNEVRVFNNASTASNAAPTRTFTFTSNFLTDLAVDTTKDIAYVHNLDSITNLTQISVFDNASALSGSVTPNRTIAIGDSFSSGSAIGMFIDPGNDRLYAPRIGQIMVFDAASTKSGPVSGSGAPSRTINLSFADYSNIFVELTANRLYSADIAGVNIIDNASTVSGSPPITRVLVPAGSVFKAVVVKP
jgi:hypothetical protein